MINIFLKDIKIESIACTLPKKKVELISRIDDFGVETVKKIIEKTGVESIYVTEKNQTASDLAYVSAKNIIKNNKSIKDQIGVLILVTQTPDYRMPATSFILHKRLELSEDCICFDINLGCSGYINGLNVISSIMNNSNIKYGLLLAAETPSKRISRFDRSLSMIFGDCGTATLISRQEGYEIDLSIKSFGERYKKIIVPAGAYRNINYPKKAFTWPDGNIRTYYDTYMNGQDVFSFTIIEVPIFIKKYLEEKKLKAENFDYLVLHQANEYILKQIAKKIGIGLEKLPISMKKYGNTSSTSIPLTIAYLREMGEKENKKVLMSAFGIGLSWAIASLDLDFSNVMKIEYSDEEFKDGGVSKDSPP